MTEQTEPKVFETDQFFIDEDGYGEPCIWYGKGPDDFSGSARLVVRKHALDRESNELWPLVVASLASAATQTAEQAPQDGWRTAFQAMDGWLSRMIDQIEGLPEGERIDGQHDAYVRAAGVVSLAMQYPERAKAEIFNLPAGSPVTETTKQPEVPAEIALIAAERKRVIADEGRTPDQDDRYVYGELTFAAAAYLGATVGSPPCLHPGQLWPWGFEHFKAGDALANLVKAGQLVAAEIARLQRDRARAERSGVTSETEKR